MSRPAADAAFEPIWQVPDGQVASGRIPGYAAAVRIRGRTAVRAGGTMAVETGSAVMSEDTLFRIASATKPVGGALTLSLVQDGVLALDDPVARCCCTSVCTEAKTRSLPGCPAWWAILGSNQ